MSNFKNDNQESIFKTLTYADIFDFPLTLQEVHKYLISSIAYSIEEIQREIKSMREIKELEGYYFLVGKEESVKERKKREKYSEVKMKKAKRIALTLKCIPWIKLLAVTGSLAVKNASSEDDIDILIVTSTGRLWLTRLLVTTFLFLTNNYRHGKRIKNKICPNIYLDINNLLIDQQFQNLYTAHEIAQVLPIINKNKTYERFIFENRWVQKLLGNTEIPEKVEEKTRRNRSVICDRLESLSFRLQYFMMKKRITTEIVEKGIAKFHPGDISQRILSEFAIRL